jgi:type IV pilus assembly protein PilC
MTRNRAGQTQTGVVQARSRNELAATLRKQGLLVLEVTEQKSSEGLGWLARLNPLQYRPMRHQDVEEGFHQLAVMLRSGLDLVSALEIVADYSRLSVRRVWLQVIQRIRVGNSLTDALGEHKVFGKLTVQLVKVGEQTGYLERSMLQASTEMEESRKIRSQLISALTYPMITLVFALGVTAYMLHSIIPELKKFLLMMGRKLPPITQSLIDISNWFDTYGVLLLIGILTVAAVFVLLYQFPRLRLAIDFLMLRLPVVGHVLRLSGTVSFSRSLSALLRSGVRIVDALETVARLNYNSYLAQCVDTARRRVIEGSSLAEPLAAAKYGYMPMLHRMVVIGENSGTLDEVLSEVTLYHQEILEKKIRLMSEMIAPVITVVVGGIIGFVYAAFMVAMFSAGGGGGGLR